LIVNDSQFAQDLATPKATFPGDLYQLGLETFRTLNSLFEGNKNPKAQPQAKAATN
jgi:hypothetical protein